jgi:hypothetical protein
MTNPVRSRFRWADEHPEALQELVDPTIRVVASDLRPAWTLPAGWVRIVNELHNDPHGVAR